MINIHCYFNGKFRDSISAPNIGLKGPSEQTSSIRPSNDSSSAPTDTHEYGAYGHRRYPGGGLYQPLSSSPRLVLQVHDELIFEVSDDQDISRIARVIKYYMENAVELRLPLEVQYPYYSS